MSFTIILDHKKYQPELGINSIPESYTITVSRSDGKGLSKVEVLTAMQMCIKECLDKEAIKNDC